MGTFYDALTHYLGDAPRKALSKWRDPGVTARLGLAPVEGPLVGVWAVRDGEWVGLTYRGAPFLRALPDGGLRLKAWGGLSGALCRRLGGLLAPCTTSPAQGWALSSYHGLWVLYRGGEYRTTNVAGLAKTYLRYRRFNQETVLRYALPRWAGGGWLLPYYDGMALWPDGAYRLPYVRPSLAELCAAAETVDRYVYNAVRLLTTRRGAYRLATCETCEAQERPDDLTHFATHAAHPLIHHVARALAEGVAEGDLDAQRAQEILGGTEACTIEWAQHSFRIAERALRRYLSRAFALAYD